MGGGRQRYFKNPDAYLLKTRVRIISSPSNTRTAQHTGGAAGAGLQSAAAGGEPGDDDDEGHPEADLRQVPARPAHREEAVPEGHRQASWFRCCLLVYFRLICYVTLRLIVRKN